MKLSEIRMCDNCDGPVSQMFYVARFSIALIKPDAGNQVLGLARMFRGSMALAEVMAPEPDCITVAMDDKEHQGLTTELLLCTNCYCGNVNLALLAEKRAEQMGKAEG
jgi:hypothetical protein